MPPAEDVEEVAVLEVVDKDGPKQAQHNDRLADPGQDVADTRELVTLAKIGQVKRTEGRGSFNFSF